ncbi:hypothetical protein B0H16DRAFT_38823 [Mycena metata]|uniref:Uncharacterized protein n=1 Tax=Mycena metata TaxID=1033252 RepID=A0AAD7P358_9AGAR|nr:hypothetical protein B0H16DRAFT_893263 [Mycena metata]KAJ7786629.1 hypothetical protein B0H16DRAFT_38823 [Mycena metata]
MDIVYVLFEHVKEQKYVCLGSYKEVVAACCSNWPIELQDNTFTLSRKSEHNGEWWEVHEDTWAIVRPFDVLRVHLKVHIKTRSPTVVLDAPITRRRALVEEIVKRLDENSFLQIRGSAASGKTTLLNLVHLHLRSNGVHVVRYDDPWPTNSAACKFLHSELVEAYNRADNENPTCILIDEGQTTYQDLILWNRFFKSWSGHGRQGFSLLIACAWGSTSSHTMATGPYTPMELDASRRLELRPSAVDPWGLLFRFEESNELIDSAVNAKLIPQLDQDLRKHLHERSSGYAAVLRSLVSYIQADKALARRSVQYTLTEFVQDRPPHRYLPFLQSDIQCKKFLPQQDLARDPRVNRVFTRLFLQGPFDYNEGDPTPGGLDRLDLNYAHNMGLIYVEHLASPNPMLSPRRLSMTFPLQTALIQMSLEPAQPDNFVDVSSLFSLVLDVVQQFNPEHLKTPKCVGGTINDTPLEATYQHKFYHCLYRLRPRAVLCCDYGTPAGSKLGGRIDFLIHRDAFKNGPRSWGIELLQEGDRLNDHASRFDPVSGAYRAMTSQGMDQFYILDFRMDVPVLAHG